MKSLHETCKILLARRDGRRNSRCIDGRKMNNGAARFANDARGSNAHNNSTFSNLGFGIKALVSYGRGYWNKRSFDLKHSLM